MTFYFYDLETSGFRARADRIMQFAGQRTDLNLEPIGPPDKYYLKMTLDILPSPQAVLLTSITPQMTIQQGISEAQFLKIFHQKIALPDTIFCGYNNIRFDDEFMRYANYRNFYDAYKWQWHNGRSRWDLLDVLRMMRALRPDGLNWPFNDQQIATNKLADLAATNNLDHTQAHDALADVDILIQIARLAKQAQSKLWIWLMKMRTKTEVEKFLKQNSMFVYTSGKYRSEFSKTTVATILCQHPRRGYLVYDLRSDPQNWSEMTPQQLAEAWKNPAEDKIADFPIKNLGTNRCPAIAPMSVLDSDSCQRLQLDLESVKRNLNILNKPVMAEKLLAALKIIEQTKSDVETEIKPKDSLSYVEEKLYDGFFGPSQQQFMEKVLAYPPDKFADLQTSDNRLSQLLVLYKAHNYPDILDKTEVINWKKYILQKLTLGNPSYIEIYQNELNQLKKSSLPKEKVSIIDDLLSWSNEIKQFCLVGKT